MWKRWGLAFIGAIILEYAAGIAGGCTSGLAISGGMLLAPAAFLFIAGMFASGIITAYRTDIIWDPAWPSLLFEERNRPDAPYSHRGRLYIPPSSQFIHLVSLTKGAMRMVIVSQIDRLGQMRGLITTLNKRGAMFVPVSTPIVYARKDDFKEGELGEIGPDQPAYGNYHAVLHAAVAEGYASLVPVAEAKPR